MNIKQLIADLRARVNPQYYDQIGTESYERHQVVKALEYLATENERQRFDILAMNRSLDLLREENERLRVQLAEARKNDVHCMAWLADCRIAVDDNGKRMLPEFVEYLKALKQQRDELLASLKDAREMVSDWAGYASPYFQEKHDIDGDLKKLDDAIARMEG